MTISSRFDIKRRQLQKSSILPEPIESKNIAYRAGRGLVGSHLDLAGPHLFAFRDPQPQYAVLQAGVDVLGI
ncbi:hypothetical protein Thivi_0665 [Thiocystis violascens DSM 198]|uniref:Uncharacterized protein n=1 Tax=Thiocystis violascens (strain ATCC 17096 / DSM 198 / 6111) TaxID=765911 RepID=I3Y6V1_THIV6|nr:hypothetical protein Thivi_0665 [Thiocystis violascens DSM 198]